MVHTEETPKLTIKNVSDIHDQVEEISVSHLEQTVEIQGVNINYVKMGSGPNALLLMCGSVGSIDSDFGLILSKFDEDAFTIVAWDYPGCGKSIPPERDFSSKAAYFDNDGFFGMQLMKKLNFEKFSLFGWCAGGINAILMAARYPQHIEKLIVSGTRSHFTETDMTIFKGIADIRNWSDQAIANFTKGKNGEHLAKLWTTLVDFYIANYETEGGKLCVDELSAIKCPTLVIHGEMDPIVPVSHGHFIQSRVPNARIITMPRGKHNLHLKYPEEFIGYVEEFLQS